MNVRMWRRDPIAGRKGGRRMKRERVDNGNMVGSGAAVMVCLLLCTGRLWAQQFPDNDTNCPDVFSTNAAFRIVTLDEGTYQVLDLSGPTVVGRSNPFAEGDPLDANAPICGTGPSSNYPNMWTSVPDACAMPLGWAEGPATRREVHTEILSLVLQGAAATIRAGQPYFDSGNPAAQRFFQVSIGEVASQDPNGNPPDFPADSFFNVFVEVDLGFRQLYNRTPLVLKRLGIMGFPPPDINLPLKEYDHLGSVPLFDENGLPFGFLTNGAHGGDGGLPLDDAPLLIRNPLSFAIDPNSVGLDPNSPPLPPRPNWVWEDKINPAKLVTVYYSPAVGGLPNMTNQRDARLTGVMSGTGAFQSGDMITGLSFGQDGTRFRTGTLFFSVGRDSVGVYCTDVWYNTTGYYSTPPNAAAADIYVSSVGPFGRYTDRATPALGLVNTNRLAADGTQLGLRSGVILQQGEDNLTALELSRFERDHYYQYYDDYAYFTFGGPSFAGNEARIYFYDPATGPFEPANLAVFALGSDLGLQSGDKIDALVLADVTAIPGQLRPNGIMEPGPRPYYQYYDEVLFSLAPGSPTLLANPNLSAADIFYSDFSGSFTLFASAANLGLLTTDDVDALDIRPTNEPQAHGACCHPDGSCTDETPDECDPSFQPTCNGDMNGDGDIDFIDINWFVLYLSNFEAWKAACPGCYEAIGDINCDGTYGQGSFGDINWFVWLITQCAGGCACPGPGSCGPPPRRPGSNIWLGPNTSCADCGAVCESEILAKTVGNTEAEPVDCNDPLNYNDTYNSGCDATSPPGPTLTLNFGAANAWRGRTFSVVDPNNPTGPLKKDYDWYNFTVTGGNRRFEVYLYADFPATWEIWKQNDCAYGPIEGLQVPACHDAGVFTVRCYTAGPYWLRVFPTGYTPCGRYYYLALTEATSCTPCAFSCTGQNLDDLCDDLTAYDTNAGCDDPNAPPPHFMTFNFGTTYCGRIYAGLQNGAPYYDPDWFQITQTYVVPKKFKFALTTEFLAHLEIYADCTAYNNGTPLEPGTDVYAALNGSTVCPNVVLTTVNNYAQNFTVYGRITCVDQLHNLLTKYYPCAKGWNRWKMVPTAVAF
jgi:hypothetical protein